MFYTQNGKNDRKIDILRTRGDIKTNISEGYQRHLKLLISL